MAPVFLLGGGWHADTFPQTYRHILQAVTQDGHCRLAIIVAEEPDVDTHGRFLQSRGAFEAVGLAADQAVPFVVSADAPLALDALSHAAPTGIFVCGGLTPAYYAGLCVDRAWYNYVQARHLPYAGFSAGAMIAAEAAIIGGWQRVINDRVVPIADEYASEDIDILDVRPGLGAVPFAVDVHASQAGTLTRLVHALDQGAAESGWAIDEDTMLAVANGAIHVHGRGNAYFVQRQSQQLSVKIVQAGAEYRVK